MVLKKGYFSNKIPFYIKHSMAISWKGITSFLLTSILLMGNQTNHRINMILSYQSNSCYKSDYELLFIVINGKIRSVPLNILSSVFTILCDDGVVLFVYM